jgi:hypothetical protein
MKYERLTERKGYSIGIYVDKDFINKGQWQNVRELVNNTRISNIENVFDRLAELEDDLESGKIIRLHCKVGDTIYYINRNNNVVEEDVVKFFTFTKDGIKPILTRHNKKFWEFYEWNKTVFLTREEAEAKLKELQKK